MCLILWRGHRLRQTPRGIRNITQELGTFLGLAAEGWFWKAGAVVSFCTLHMGLICQMQLCHSKGSSGSRFHVCWGRAVDMFFSICKSSVASLRGLSSSGGQCSLRRRCCDAFWSGLLEGLGLRTPSHVCGSGPLGPLLGRPAAVTGVSLVTSTLVFVNSRRTGI